MILYILAIAFGLILLLWSADRFVDGAVGVAHFLGMSTFLIGMVVVGFGTSAPEMVVSILSALNNTPQLALGNAYGSNIANIALILGATALITPLVVHKQALARDIPILILSTVLTVFLLKDGNVSFMDGVILLVVFFLVMAFNILQEMKAKRKRKAERDSEALEAEVKNLSIVKSLLWLLVGLGLLVLSSRMLVWGAVNMAKVLGVSDLLIGLTIVAVGTSLPELASSIAAARKQARQNPTAQPPPTITLKARATGARGEVIVEEAPPETELEIFCGRVRHVFPPHGTLVYRW